MGTGKSTFARALLNELSPDFSSHGSPTFPLVQQYPSHEGHPIYHIDLYRLKNDVELEDSGILHQIEEPGSLSLVEWPNLFPDSFAFWRKQEQKGVAKAVSFRAKNVIEIKIENSDQGPDLRNYRIQYL